MHTLFSSQTSVDIDTLSPSEYSYFLAHGVLETVPIEVDPEACWFQKCEPYSSCDYHSRMDVTFKMLFLNEVVN